MPAVERTPVSARSPASCDSVDLAFRLNGAGEMVEEIKWSQPPVLYSSPDGYNGWNEKSVYESDQIVADDWVCTNATPVTDSTGGDRSLAGPSHSRRQLPDAFMISILDATCPKGRTNPSATRASCIDQLPLHQLHLDLCRLGFRPARPHSPAGGVLQVRSAIAAARILCATPGHTTPIGSALRPNT